jgi:hypothetical protein
VLELGRWGADEVLGTLNFLGTEKSRPVHRSTTVPSWSDKTCGGSSKI